MASKEAKDVKESKADTTPAPSFYAFELKLSKDKVKEATNKQVKSRINELLTGFGAFEEIRVVGTDDRTVTVFFTRLFAKGQAIQDALTKGETKPTLNLYDESVEYALSQSKPSGGGISTNTASRPKKESAKKDGGRGRGRGRGEDGKEGDGKEDGKDGGRGRGRGGPKKEEPPRGSLQRGRASIGGKLGHVSKMRLAKQAAALGLTVKKDEAEEADKEAAKKEAGKAAGKKEGGKKEAGKAEGGKKEAGKKEAGKAEAGKKEAGKAEAKKEGGKGKGK